VKYGNRSGVDARVRVDESASRIEITIQDHGPGVGPDDRDRLFRRFERGTERPSGEGSGLGLYVSRELCRAMDGDLVLQPPVEGRGAALTVHLPAEAPLES
jgi:signal transduction histidine kinase